MTTSPRIRSLRIATALTFFAGILMSLALYAAAGFDLFFDLFAATPGQIALAGFLAAISAGLVLVAVLGLALLAESVAPENNPIAA